MKPIADITTETTTSESIPTVEDSITGGLLTSTATKSTDLLIGRGDGDFKNLEPEHGDFRSSDHATTHGSACPFSHEEMTQLVFDLLSTPGGEAYYIAEQRFFSLMEPCQHI